MDPAAKSPVRYTLEIMKRGFYDTVVVVFMVTVNIITVLHTVIIINITIIINSHTRVFKKLSLITRLNV